MMVSETCGLPNLIKNTAVHQMEVKISQMVNTLGRRTMSGSQSMLCLCNPETMKLACQKVSKICGFNIKQWQVT